MGRIHQNTEIQSEQIKLRIVNYNLIMKKKKPKQVVILFSNR